MASSRIKAKEKSGVVTVKVLAKHDMISIQEAVNNAKKSGKPAKVNFITHMKAESAGKVVFDMQSTQFLSKNPYVKFSFPGKAGDDLTFSWVDLDGKTQSDTTKIK